MDNIKEHTTVIRKILIIDDDQVDRIALKRILKKFDSQIIVDEAENGKLGIEQFKKELYDCVFLDFNLPDRNGPEILKDLVQVSGNGVMVVGLTGEDSEMMSKQMIEAGATDYLIKDNLNQNVIARTLHFAMYRKSFQKSTEYKFRQIFEFSNDGIVMCDIQGNLYDVNYKAQEMWGFNRKEFLEKTVLDLHSERSKEEALRILKETSQKKVGNDTEGVVFETEFLRKGGSCFYADISVKLLSLEGEPIMLGVIRDITDRKNMQNELIRSNKELNEFAHITAHDLKAPVRNILSFTEMVLEDNEEAFNEETKEMLKRVMKIGKGMQSLIGGLLKFGQVGGAVLELTPVDLNTVIDGVTFQLQSELEKVGGEIICGPLPTIIADELLIKMLFQNLLENAIKYRHIDIAPKIQVSVEKEVNTSSVSTIEPSFYQITVSDNGIGFDMKHMEKMFKPFQRLVSNSEFSGSGLGLATVKKIVDHHHGSIDVQSRVGKGSTFSIKFPKKRE